MQVSNYSKKIIFVGIQLHVINFISITFLITFFIIGNYKNQQIDSVFYQA